MATLLPPGELQFLDNNGAPLAGGTVTFYVPSTTTPKDTFMNAGQSILNSNPVTLDSAGRAIIYGSGTYRQVVKDALGNLIWDQITAEPGAGPVSYAGTSAGTANAQTLASGRFDGTDGSVITFFAGLSNTGPMTISVGGSAPTSLTKNGPTGPVALASGDIILGNIYSIAYSSTLASFQLLQSITPTVTTGSFLAGNIFGLTLSNNVGSPTTAINVAVGQAASDASPPFLLMLANITGKRLDQNWVVGGTAATPVGGLDTGTAADGTYHVFLIQRSDTGLVDVLLSTSVSAPSMPANYDRKRRIGSILRVSGSIKAFSQNGDEFLWLSAPTDVAAAAVGTSPQLPVLSVPTGVKVTAIFNASLLSNTAGTAILFTSPDQTSVVAGLGNAQLFCQVNNVGAPGCASIRTNASGQIRVVSNATSATSLVTVFTQGYVDTRGRLA